MPKTFPAVIRSHSGSTAIEYALIAGAIGVVIVGATSSVGQALLAWFQTLADAL